MVTVSPKHHQGWLVSRRKLLQKNFSMAKAKELKKAFVSKQGLEALPKAKWPPGVKSFVASLDGSKAFKFTALKDLTLLLLVVSPFDENNLLYGFFTPVGDPLLKCYHVGPKIEWKPLKLDEKARAENRAFWLKKLSISMKRQAGLAPPPKERAKKKKTKRA